MPRKEHIDPIPEQFATYEEAAEFWDTHDTTDYPQAFQTVKVETEFRGRFYEIDIAEDVGKILQQRAQQLGIPVGDLATRLLRKELSMAGQPGMVA